MKTTLRADSWRSSCKQSYVVLGSCGESTLALSASLSHGQQPSVPSIVTLSTSGPWAAGHAAEMWINKLNKLADLPHSHCGCLLWAEATIRKQFTCIQQLIQSEH